MTEDANGDVAREISAYADLAEGWDGERAAAASRASIRDATRFLGASPAAGWEPSLHVDGSVILEDPDAGSYRFPGDGTVVFATDAGRGRIAIDDAVRDPGRRVPGARR